MMFYKKCLNEYHYDCFYISLNSNNCLNGLPPRVQKPNTKVSGFDVFNDTVLVVHDKVLQCQIEV